MSGRVLIVGSINVDLVVTVARLPAPGETVTGGSFERHAGGKGGNQAVAAARMGADVTFVGAVGADDLGDAAVTDLASEGIDVRGVTRIADAATGVALIVVDATGENQIAVASGANTALNERMVEAALNTFGPAAPDVFLANLEIPDAAVLAGARWAAGRGARIVINPAPARELRDELLALHPILLPNELEAEALSGERDPAAAAAALAARTGAPVIVTLGELGALVHEAGRAELIPAASVEVVDATGAGDTLAGVLAALLAGGSSLSEAARVAVRAASKSVAVAGARAGMPTRAELGIDQ